MQPLPRESVVHVEPPFRAPAPQPAPTQAPEQFTAEQLAAIRDATERSRKIRRAASVAAFNTWAVGIFAVPGLLFGLFDFETFVMGAAFTVIAYNEYCGAKGLRRYDLKATRLLGWNQVGLAVTLVLYGLWGIWSTLAGPGAYEQEIMQMPQLAPTLEPLGDLYKTIALLTYGTVIGGSIIFQGLNAWYYFSRAELIRDYLRCTAPWIIQLQRTAAEI